MYHILPPKRQRQYGPFGWKNHPLPLAATHPPGLVELSIAVLARIRGVDEKVDVAPPRRRLDLLRARDQRPGARFPPKSVQRRLTQPALDPVPQTGWDGNLPSFETPRPPNISLSPWLRGLPGGAW